MATLVPGGNCSDAWLSVVEHLLDCSGDSLNVVVEIDDPTSESPHIRRLLDQFLRSTGKKPIEEAANTIFPKSLYFPTSGRESLYHHYETAWPLIKLFNKWGTYFYRMIHWEAGNERLNQLEDTICKLRGTASGTPRYRSIYEVSIYRPDTDRRITMGGPCLSHLSFKLAHGRLHLTAVYRNQYYIERAYGNFIGLGRLVEYVANESQIPVGQLTCISTHAELDGSKKSVGSLVRSCHEAVRVACDKSGSSRREDLSPHSHNDRGAV